MDVWLMTDPMFWVTLGQNPMKKPGQATGLNGVGDDGYWRALQLSGLAEGLTR